jgi:hypothetical protein
MVLLDIFIFVVWYEYLGDSLPQNYSWSWVKILGLRGDVQINL